MLNNYAIQGTACNARRALYTLYYCILYTVQCTVYSVQCTVNYTHVRCTVYVIHCTVEKGHLDETNLFKSAYGGLVNIE